MARALKLWSLNYCPQQKCSLTQWPNSSRSRAGRSGLEVKQTWETEMVRVAMWPKKARRTGVKLHFSCLNDDSVNQILGASRTLTQAQGYDRVPRRFRQRRVRSSGRLLGTLCLPRGLPGHKQLLQRPMCNPCSKNECKTWVELLPELRPAWRRNKFYASGLPEPVYRVLERCHVITGISKQNEVNPAKGSSENALCFHIAKYA